MDVRLQSRLSARDAMVEDRVEATTMVDLYHGEELLVPAADQQRDLVEYLKSR